jgi:hypothetical protein
MELTAKLVQILPLQTGSGKNGEWKKQDIIVETSDQYPKKVCVSIWGDKINKSILQEGAMLRISFNVESREYNNRWYTDIKAWKIEAGASGGGSTAEQAQSYQDIPPVSSGGPDDLPF